MDRNNDFERAVRQRDLRSIIAMMFEDGKPILKYGFRTETELWDFKSDCPKPIKSAINAWAEIAKDILGFYNYKGGVLIFGIRDDDFSFSGATNRLDSKLINDQIRKFLGDRIWVEYYREFIQPDNHYLGLALIPPRGPVIERFKIDAPLEARIQFKKGDSAIREGDSTRVLNEKEVLKLISASYTPTVGKFYAIDEPFYRIISPDYSHFIKRENFCEAVETAIRDPRTAISAITGIGGVGKTALATWATLRAYERGDFGFIVSITAKDRELTQVGIKALRPDLTSYESLLNNILDVLRFTEYKEKPIQEKSKQVVDIIRESNGLIFVDNLETVDDPRIIRFLDELPLGVHAITTSRRMTVRVSTRPMDLGPFTEEEVIMFVRSLSDLSGLGYVRDFGDSECLRIGNACDGIPLAIKWALSKGRSASEALVIADNITSTGFRGEELLEFCFRRIFDAMPGQERLILQVLSMFQRPLPLETILVGANISPHKIQDVIELLINDSIIHRLFDPDLNDYLYSLLPITRTFVHLEVLKQPQLEKTMRRRLSDYFEARDIKDPDEKVLIRTLRQGTDSGETSLLDLAKAAQRRGDVSCAKNLFEQALSRSRSNWRVAREFAEFCRHTLIDTTKALQLYDAAATHAPSMGSDRALIFRERGMLYRESGLPDATEIAIDNFKIALEETPNDPITRHALAQMYKRNGAWDLVIDLLEGLTDHKNIRTREKVMPLLLEAYTQKGEILKAARLKMKMKEDGLY